MESQSYSFYEKDLESARQWNRKASFAILVLWVLDSK